MRSIGRKVALAGLVSAFAMTALLAPFSNALASKPKIKEITKRTTTSITLPLKYEEREDERVVIKVRIRDNSTGMVETRTYRKTLSEDEGRKKLEIDNLKPGVKYTFKVKIKKASGDSGYSSYSESRSATTKAK